MFEYDFNLNITWMSKVLPNWDASHSCFHIPSNSSNVQVNHWVWFLFWLLLLRLLLLLFLFLLFLLFFVIICVVLDLVIVVIIVVEVIVVVVVILQKVKSTHRFGGQPLFYNLLSRYIIKVCEMLHLFHPTFPKDGY